MKPKIMTADDSPARTAKILYWVIGAAVVLVTTIAIVFWRGDAASAVDMATGLGVLLAGVAALVTAVQTNKGMAEIRKSVIEIHVKTNSVYDQLLAATRAEGVESGRREVMDTIDELKDAGKVTEED